jgi:integrase
MPRKRPCTPMAFEFFKWRLFQRDGVFYADGRTGKSNLGKCSLGTRDPEEALVNLRKLDRRKAVELGLADSSAAEPSPTMTVREGWDLYLAYCDRGDVLGGVSPRTLKRYRAVRDKHIAFCERHGIRSWNEVSTANTANYNKWLTIQKKSYRTIYLELTLIKSAVGWLIDEHRLPDSNRLRLRLVKPQGTDTYCYRADEVRAMVRYCRSRPDLCWLGAIIVVLACTGMRIGELATLRWSDLDFRSRTIAIRDERASSRRKNMGTERRTKGRRDRTVPMHSELLALLEDLRRQKRHADGRVFHGPRGGTLKPDTVRTILVRDVIEPLKERFPTPEGDIGFGDGTVHSFRHSFL